MKTPLIDWYPSLVTITKEVVAPSKAWATTGGAWKYGAQHLTVRINPSKLLPASRRTIQEAIRRRFVSNCMDKGFEVDVLDTHVGVYFYTLYRQERNPDLEESR